MINLCSDGHEEICHEGARCPVCGVISELTDEINTLREDLDEAEKMLTELEQVK